MSITITADDAVKVVSEAENPGMQLAQLRLQRGYSVDYVASKLHLRVHIVELIERGDFHLLPQPVFIKGYLRAYSKLLGVPADPFISLYNTHFDDANKTERVALWQSKKESHRVEHFIKWGTALAALAVFTAVGIWWQQQNAEGQKQAEITETKTVEVGQAPESQAEVKSSDIASIQDLFLPQAAPRSELTPAEQVSG